ncbi:MAG: hypothetical protein WC654_07360 [Patescibacteria group bacterium]
MFKSLTSFIFISILIVLSGCAGKDFVRPTQEAFKLGKTTYSQVVQQLGEPRREGTLLKNDKNLKSITYAYAAVGGEPLEEGVIPARAMSYYFFEETLVGQEFVSSFKSDNSNFDDTKIPAIVKGKTTRSEIIQLIGRPSGSYVPPMVKATTGEALGYTYVTTRGGAFSGFKVFRKSLLISFNELDQVSETEFSSSGNK